MLTALVVLTAPLIDGVHDEGDAPRVGVWHRCRFDGAQVNPNKTVVPATLRTPSRAHTRAGTPVNLCGPLMMLALLSKPPISRGRMTPIAAVCCRGNRIYKPYSLVAFVG